MDYGQLAARAFDEPYDAELRDALLVCADQLGQAGDPRGALITMEQAMLAADGRRKHELRRGMHAHVVEHGASLVGAMTSMMQFKRALAFEWRAGQMFAIHLDTRHLAKKAMMSPAELLKLALKMPAAHTVRRLVVRVAGPQECDEIEAALAKRKHPLLLEWIQIGTRPVPTQLAQMGDFGQRLPKLLGKYPYLGVFATRDQIVAIPAISVTQKATVGPIRRSCRRCSWPSRRRRYSHACCSVARSSRRARRSARPRSSASPRSATPPDASSRC